MEYVSLLIDTWEKMGYDCEVSEWKKGENGDDEALIYFVYEDGYSEVIIFAVLLGCGISFQSVIEKVGFSSNAYEKLNQLNRLYLNYKFTIDEDGDLIMRRLFNVEPDFESFIVVGTIANELKTMGKYIASM